MDLLTFTDGLKTLNALSFASPDQLERATIIASKLGPDDLAAFFEKLSEHNAQLEKNAQQKEALLLKAEQEVLSVEREGKHLQGNLAESASHTEEMQQVEQKLTGHT